MYGDRVEAGTAGLRPGQERRLRNAVDRGNQGRMLRAAAFVDPEGSRRRGLAGTAITL